MKVLMINGSRREHGCTYTALSIIGDSLKEEGIDSEIVFVGRDAVNGNLNALIKSLGENVPKRTASSLGHPCTTLLSRERSSSFSTIYSGAIATRCAASPQRLLRLHGAPERLPHWMYSQSILQSARCQSFPQAIGRWFTATRRRMS